MNNLAKILVFIGLALLLLSLKPAFIICQLSTEQQRGWFVLFSLIVTFILGYVSFFLILMGHDISQLEIVVALIFCGGGGFVFLITKMSQKTIHLLVISAKENLHNAHHDALTLLANRRVFNQKVTDFMKNEAVFCLMLLDLDDFKKINDTLGHGCGDWVLTSVAERVQASLPEASLVARVGGDELGILVRSSYRYVGQALAQNIHQSITKGIIYEGQSLFIGASIGIAEYPLQGENQPQLLKRADIAMYYAKRHKTGYLQYSSELTF
jgi:diguanylate cyclase (GGDEF)-like protein